MPKKRRRIKELNKKETVGDLLDAFKEVSGEGTAPRGDVEIGYSQPYSPGSCARRGMNVCRSRKVSPLRGVHRPLSLRVTHGAPGLRRPMRPGRKRKTRLMMLRTSSLVTRSTSTSQVSLGQEQWGSGCQGRERRGAV